MTTPPRKQAPAKKPDDDEPDTASGEADEHPSPEEEKEAYSDLIEAPPVRAKLAEGIEEVEPGIFYTESKGIYHVEIPNGGSSISAGNHPTLEAAQAAMARVRAELNL